MALTEILEEIENGRYILAKKDLRLEKELNDFEIKYSDLKILIKNKNDLLVHYGARHVGKRDRRKLEKIKKLGNLVVELEGKLEQANKKGTAL